MPQIKLRVDMVVLTVNAKAVGWFRDACRQSGCSPTQITHGPHEFTYVLRDDGAFQKLKQAIVRDDIQMDVR